jgi:hypothetical protein
MLLIHVPGIWTTVHGKNLTQGNANDAVGST